MILKRFATGTAQCCWGCCDHISKPCVCRDVASCPSQLWRPNRETRGPSPLLADQTLGERMSTQRVAPPGGKFGVGDVVSCVDDGGTKLLLINTHYRVSYVAGDSLNLSVEGLASSILWQARRFSFVSRPSAVTNSPQSPGIDKNVTPLKVTISSSGRLDKKWIGIDSKGNYIDEFSLHGEAITLKPTPEKQAITCECGADKAGVPYHSSWCPKEGK